MLFIAKKQRLAQQSAKTLIDFTNIVDTDINGSQKQGYDEVIVFDMKQMEQKVKNQMVGSSVLNSSRRSQSRSRSRTSYNRPEGFIDTEPSGAAEMKDLEKQYKKQGLGGYEDEESLDNSVGRVE